MSVLLSCQGLEKGYSAKSLFSGLTFGVFEGDRLGIIGNNGAGKSTLLRILAGLEEPDQGQVVQRKFLKLAYVPQQSHFVSHKTVYETLAELALGAGIAPADVENQISRSLSKVGFTDHQQKIQTLSGGWQKRLAIAGGLVQEPDVLLLDEPTNHLDIHGVLWLEQLLKNIPCAWVAVSHDRYFLEQTVTKVAEISSIYENGLLLAEGRYSDFLQQRADYLADQHAYAASLANKVRREIEWLRRGAKARTTKAKYRVDEAHNMQDELSQLNARLKTTSSDIDFSGSQRKTKRLIEVQDVGMRLGEKSLLNHLSLTLSPGMRLGLLGANGSGKSTLLKILLGEQEPTTGSIKRAENLQCVYFDQTRAALDPTRSLQRTLAEEGDAVVYRGRSIHVASWAKRFQFRQEQLALPVGELSGGEQARVLIARMMLQPADVLLLDEPTNDLDISTLEVLEESLQEFPGALVLVSHDRFLMDRVCNIFVGLDGQGGSEVFADYFQWQDALRAQTNAAKAKEEKSDSSSERSQKTNNKRLSYMEQREYDMMEEAIMNAELELDTAQNVVDDPSIATQTQRLMEATAALSAAQEKVDRLYARWSELEAKLK